MSDSTIRLAHESCFDFLLRIDTDSVDLALIDPPYEVSRETGFRNGKETGRDVDRFRVTMDFGEWDAVGFVGLSSVITELYRVLRNGGTLICFYDLWKLTTLRDYFDTAGFKQMRQ